MLVLFNVFFRVSRGVSYNVLKKGDCPRGLEHFIYQETKTFAIVFHADGSFESFPSVPLAVFYNTLNDVTLLFTRLQRWATKAFRLFDFDGDFHFVLFG